MAISKAATYHREKTNSDDDDAEKLAKRLAALA